MKIKKRKQCSKHISFYKTHFGIHEPFQVLVDLTFCQIALQCKISIKEQLPKYFAGKVQLYTTQCIIEEGKILGPGLRGALFIAEKFEKRKCGHKTSKPASECIQEIIGKKNEHGLFVASQDRILRASLQEIPGVPLLHISHNAIIFEKPSIASLNHVEKEEIRKVAVADNEKETISKLKASISVSVDDAPRRKRKRIKGANPLSMLKKKRKIELTTSQNDNSIEKKKRIRKKRRKVPSHVLEELRKRQGITTDLQS